MSICVVDGGPCQCQPSEGCPCPGVAALHAKDSIRTREHNLLVAENRSQSAEIAALRAEVAGLERVQKEYEQASMELLEQSVAFAERVQVALSPEDVATVKKLRAILDAARKGEA